MNNKWMNTPEGVIAYLEEKGWELRQKGNQWNIKACPFCGDNKWHFYLNQERGAFDCKKCQEHGSFFDLRCKVDNGELSLARKYVAPAFPAPKKFVKPDPKKAEDYHKVLMNDQKTLAYLHNRGITVESAVRAQLGVCDLHGNGQEWLAIPHYRADTLISIKYRRIFGADKSFQRETNTESILYNEDVIASNQDALIITEGELDALTLIQAGFPNVVGTTGGAGTFLPEWIDCLAGVRRIYVCYDNDSANPKNPGQMGARNLAKRLGFDRCYNVVLPDGVNDVNDFFCRGGGTAEIFRELVGRAERWDLDHVCTTFGAIQQAAEMMENELAHEGFSTGWENVDRIMGRLKPGHMITIGAPPKTGKTSFALNIAQRLAGQGSAVLYYCLEMLPGELVVKMIQADRMIAEDKVNGDELFNAASRWYSLPMYFNRSMDVPTKIDNMINGIEAAIKRYDIKLLIFDNIHILARGDQANDRLDEASRAFKLLAMRMEIPVIVVAQPKKLENGRLMTTNDFKHSNMLIADSDIVMILQRPSLLADRIDDACSITEVDETLSPVTVVQVQAGRRVKGGQTMLLFKGEISRFFQMTADREANPSMK